MKINKVVKFFNKKYILVYGFFFMAFVSLPSFTEAGGITNPLGSTAGTLPKLIEVLIKNIIVPIGIPIATIFLIYSGFLFVKAQGKPEEITKAKETFMWTIIGIAVLLGAWVLVNAVQGTINQIR